MNGERRIAVGPTVIAWIGLFVVIVLFAAWVTHLVAAFKAGTWLFLLGGAFVFPLGIVHGIAVWCGLW